MGSTWAHLLVVHIPVLLSPVALFFLIRAMRSAATTDFKLAYSFVLICAIASVVAYLTGPPAAEWLTDRIVMVQEQVENHGLWGRISFTVMVLAGAASLIAILAYLQGEEPHPWLARVVFGLTLLGLACLSWAAHLGGILRRPELGF